MSPTSENAAALGEELRNIVDHAAALLGALADAPDGNLDPLRERVADSIETARTRLDELQSDVESQSERAAEAIDRWIAENPWTAVAIGAGVGLAVGLLLSRRRRAPADAAPR